MSQVMTTPSVSSKRDRLSSCQKAKKADLSYSNNSTLEKKRYGGSGLEKVKRSRYDSLLNISSTSTPVNSLPRKRKAVTRRDSTEQSHASLVSQFFGNNSSGNSPTHNLPKPLYFEVAQPVPAPLIGREWLWSAIRSHLESELPTNPGVVIKGRPGAGKTACILSLVERSCFGHKGEQVDFCKDVLSYPSHTDENLCYLSNQVVAYHFCQSDVASTCHVPEFVHSIAAQLSQCPQLAPYQQLLLSPQDNVCKLLSSQSCQREPSRAFVQGVLEPLKRLSLSGQLTLSLGIIVVDGVCEAQHHRPDYGDTIATFLQKHVQDFPSWLKIVTTIRSSAVDIIHNLPFHHICLDTVEDERIKKDLTDYIAMRSNDNLMGLKLSRNAGPSKTILAKMKSFLTKKSNGCFLYLKLVMDLLEKGNITIRTSFKNVPQNLSEIYQLTFNLKYCSSDSFVQVGELLSICLASLQPITLSQAFTTFCHLYLTSDMTWTEFEEKYNTISDILVTRKDGTLMCFHPTLRDWLLGRYRDSAGSKFVIDLHLGHAAIALCLSRQQGHKTSEKMLEMAHHILKTNIFKNCQNSPFYPRQLQACFTAISIDDVSLTLSSVKNIYSPIIKVSRLLLLAGGDPNGVTDQCDGHCLVGVHSGLGHTDMVALLLEYGADPNMTNTMGVSPLSMASAGGHLDIVQLLLQCGATLNTTDKDGVTPVVAAARHGHLNVLEHLIEQEWTTDEMKTQAMTDAFIQAVLYHQATVAEMILDLGVIDLSHNDTISGLDCLSAAVNVENLELLQNLLTKDLLPSNLNAAVLQAASVGNADIVQCLISAGADLAAKDEKGRSLLMVSASSGHCSCLELLLSLGADLEQVDHEGLTALTAAIINNDVSSAAVLLQRGAKVNSLDCSGRTPLDIAIYQGSPHMVEILLDHGADMETPDGRGIRPLDRVICHGHTDIVHVFLRKGAKLGATSWAMAQTKPDIQDILLNKLLDDGTTLYKRHKFVEACQRFKYALKRLGSILTSDWSVGQEQENNWPIELETNLLINLSRVERRLGRHQSAIHLSSKVIERDPSNVQALCTRGKAERSLGLMREAFVDFNSALELVPQNQELKKVILKMKNGFKNEMSASIISFCSHDSIKFIDDAPYDI